MVCTDPVFNQPILIGPGSPVQNVDIERFNIVHEKGDTFAPWLTSDSTVDVLSLINIKGDSNLLYVHYVQNLRISLAISFLQSLLR